MIFYKGAIPPGFFYSNETRAGKSGEIGRLWQSPKITQPFIFPQKSRAPHGKALAGRHLCSLRNDDKSSSIGAAPCYFLWGKMSPVPRRGVGFAGVRWLVFRALVSLERVVRVGN